MKKLCWTAARCAPVLLMLATVGCGEDESPLRVNVTLHEASSTLRAHVTREIAAGETLHLQVRRGEPTLLDCGSQSGSIAEIQESPVSDPAGPTYQGPTVDDTMFQNVYDTSWLELPEPTAEMLAAIADGSWVIDVCIMNGGNVVYEDSMNILEALDRAGANGKFDGDDEERIASPAAYADLCVSEMGEIPFFEPLGEGDYGTYNCLDSVPIPTRVTDADGNETFPETEQSTCDDPQYIYSLCEPNAVSGRTNGPRVTSARNDQGTHWVLLCRKAKAEEGEYNDIAMIGHNPFTGRTCFFQNALYSRTDGLHVPHPGDRVSSDASPQESASLWEGMHGGLGSGIECAECHDADPFVHTPWIDGALDEDGDPVIPRMGVDEDFALGFNETPYSIVNLAGQGWTMPQQIVGDEVAPCTRCHRIGTGRWATSWIRRLMGTDSGWTGKTTDHGNSFPEIFWMPEVLAGESLGYTTREDFEAGPEYAAMLAIEACGNNPSSCETRPVPTEQILQEGELPTIDLEGEELAREAGKVLGADVDDPTCPGGDCRTRRCAECHSTSRNNLNHWLDLTQDAWNDCNLSTDPESMSQEQAMQSVNCMRADPSDETSVFAADKIGILAAGVQYGYFRDLFRKAFGDDAWLTDYLRFRSRVSMPKGGHPRLTEIEYATVLKWFQNGLNDIDVIRQPPAPTECTSDVSSSALQSHISTMEFDGWLAINRDNGLRMHGCDSYDASSCGSSWQDRTSDWGNAGAPGTLRQAHQLDFRTSFWTRSSADGRFVGNGGSSGNSGGATITDLQSGRNIGVQASYDPGFFPDNSAFIFQGGGAGFCQQSVLESGDDFIDFTEAGCFRARGINLYQHVARAIEGGSAGDYFVINSQFTSDSGSSSSDVSANFGGESTMKFTPMIYDGSDWTQRESIVVESPFEGDSVMSPSGQMVISRLAGPDSASLGYVIRRVSATPSGDSYRIDINTELGRVCIPGNKVNVSFDERFFVTHHYNGEGGADIYLSDMQTGDVHQITNLGGTGKALFPHFVSNNAFYFLLNIDGNQYVVWSDAAVAAAG